MAPRRFVWIWYKESIKHKTNRGAI